MAERVYWHIGLPKTGTTYLQQILWHNADALRESGVTLVGQGHREHLWAALGMQDDRGLARRHPRAEGAWDRLLEEVSQVEGAALLTHEFFCGADDQQVARALEALAPARVDVVVTARDAAGMLAAGWQESVKNGGRRSLREVAARTERSQFGWWMWDLELVLRRWGAELPAQQIHVLPLPERSLGAAGLWEAFAQTLGINGDFDLPSRPVNQSLGVVQTEALRLVNGHLEGFGRPVDRGEWIRGYLGEDHLARQGGQRLRLDDDLAEECAGRSRRAHDLVLQRGHPVVGDPARLLGPAQPVGERTVDSVTDAEVADAAAALVATMLTDAREARRTPTPEERREARPGGLVSRLRSAGRRLLRD